MEAHSLQLSTLSGNNGTEQFNTKVSVPTKVEEDNGEGVFVENVIETKPALELENIEEKDCNLSKNDNGVLENLNELKTQETKDFIEDFKEEEKGEAVSLDETESLYENSLENVEIVKENIEEKSLEKTEEDAENQSLDIVNEITAFNEESFLKIIDASEIIEGFEEARGVIKKLYKEVFNVESFKTTIDDTVADLLAYLGVKAKELGFEREYLDAFSLETISFADRYRDKNYLPLAFKLSVWADKNKNLNESLELLNGLLRSLFAFNCDKKEEEMVKIIKNSITGILTYLESQNIQTGF